MSARLRAPLLLLLVAGVLLAMLLGAYGPVLAELHRVWHANPSYSHGYLVPLFALALLWLRRDRLQVAHLRPSLWGVPLLAAGLAFRHLSAHVYVGWFEQLSLIACLPGIAVAVGGWEALRWSWPALAFLVFMIPLPYTLEVALQEPLRKIGTVFSTYAMQTVGLPAVAEGHVIAINEVRIGVVEACSGLRMMMIFFALATAVAMLSQRPWWERILLVVSAVPIAIIANVVRITSTGMLYAWHYDRFAELVFHDLAGWLMMPLALGLLWLETQFLSRVIVEELVEPHVSPLAALAGVQPRGTKNREPSVAVGAK